MSEIPEYVGYANDLVEKLGNRLEGALRETVAEMATKSDLALVEERAKNDREEVADLRVELGKTRDEIQANKEEAVQRGRRIWRTLWGTAAATIVALAPSIFSFLTTH